MTAPGVRLGDGSLHPFSARRENDLRAEGFEQVAPLDAHRVRHGEDGLVAFGAGHPREADAGVAAGGLDDGGAGAENSALLGIFDHRQGDAVLDASAGVERFNLERDARLLAFEAADLQQRSVADEVGQFLVNHNFVNIRIIH